MKVHDDAFGDPEIWDDVLDAACRARRNVFANAVGRSHILASVGPRARLDAPADQPIAYLEVVGDGGTACRWRC